MFYCVAKTFRYFTGIQSCSFLLVCAKNVMGEVLSSYGIIRSFLTVMKSLIYLWHLHITEACYYHVISL